MIRGSKNFLRNAQKTEKIDFFQFRRNGENFWKTAATLSRIVITKTDRPMFFFGRRRIEFF